MPEPDGPEPAHPLRAGAAYFRAHGLGNDYLVFSPPERDPASDGDGWTVTPRTVRRICDRHRGVGGDGIVVLTDRSPTDGIFPLQMFNPDGSAFERSGNGLRVLAAYLTRAELVGEDSFQVRTGGDVVSMVVHGIGEDGEFDISVEMGRARVGADQVAVNSAHLDGGGRAIHPVRGPIDFTPVSVGNPHAVVFVEASSELLLQEIGAFLATHPAFPDGTNVQLVTAIPPDRLRIRIWERGVGRTSASGTSSCAAATAAVASGRLDPGSIVVEMDGGVLQVSVSDGLDVVLRGPVAEVSEGRLTSGFCRWLADEGIARP